MVRVIHDLLIKSTQKFADKPAVFFKDNKMSYQEIYVQSLKLASFLRSRGIQKSNRIAFFLEKRFEKVVTIFGISMAGGVFVPIRKLSHPHQASYIINNCDSKVLITTAQKLNTLKEFIPKLKSLKFIIILDGFEKESEINFKSIGVFYWNEIVQNPVTNETGLPYVISTDLASILYTSGSTGNPKGVILSHLNIISGAEKISEYLKITADDKLLSILSFGFDYGLNQLTSIFLHGGQIVLLDSLFNTDILNTIKKHQITGLAAVATTWIQLLQSDWNKENFKSLRYITNSGGAIPKNHVREIRRRVPHVKVYLMYGLTEAFRSTFLDPELVDDKPTSMGKAIPGEEIMVLNERNEKVNANETGELVHRGVLVAQGYWGDPELTSIRFRPNPLQPKEVPNREMVVFSGDYVRIDESGFLYFIGRKDEMIKSAGYRISPTEIEEVIYKSKKVKDAVVLGIPDETLGHKIRAVLSLTDNSSFTLEDLQLFCKSHLPLYMIPQELDIRNEIPRNSNGKLDRALIKKEIYQNLVKVKEGS